MNVKETVRYLKLMVEMVFEEDTSDKKRQYLDQRIKDHVEHMWTRGIVFDEIYMGNKVWRKIYGKKIHVQRVQDLR